jgi:hypothetical protein
LSLLRIEPWFLSIPSRSLVTASTGLCRLKTIIWPKKMNWSCNFSYRRSKFECIQRRNMRTDWTSLISVPLMNTTRKILWHICWRQELWSQQRQPLLGNGSAKTSVPR